MCLHFNIFFINKTLYIHTFLIIQCYYHVWIIMNLITVSFLLLSYDYLRLILKFFQFSCSVTCAEVPFNFPHSEPSVRYTTQLQLQILYIVSISYCYWTLIFLSMTIVVISHMYVFCMCDACIWFFCSGRNMCKCLSLLMEFPVQNVSNHGVNNNAT
jgi:hypothetical protein